MQAARVHASQYPVCTRYRARTRCRVKCASRRVLRRYLAYYHRAGCHLSLQGDAPEPRRVQGSELGRVIELPEVGGLHRRYVREAT